MSEIRRPTTKLGRKKDPRVDTVPPPPAKREPASQRGRPSEGMLPRVDGRRFSADEPKTSPMTRLEDLLAREKAEREADADKLGELLARATRAEAEREKLLDRLSDMEAKLNSVERERAALESQLAGGRRKHDSAPTLATARAIAGELARVLERLRDKTTTAPDLPSTKTRS
jgi:hypothetical protein